MRLTLMINLLFTASILLESFTFVHGEEDDSEDYDKLIQFKKYMGAPNIFYDEENNLVLKVTIYAGLTNRVIDSGIAAVGVQLIENTNAELVNYLSKVLNIGISYFIVYPGQTPNKKILKIKGNALRPYEVIDKLIAALEVTAKDEPEALKKTYSLENYKQSEIEDEGITKVFDWRNRNLPD